MDMRGHLLIPKGEIAIQSPMRVLSPHEQFELRKTNSDRSTADLLCIRQTSDHARSQFTHRIPKIHCALMLMFYQRRGSLCPFLKEHTADLFY
jgi:hypothetical protein